MSLNTIITGLFTIDTTIGQVSLLQAQLPIKAREVLTDANALLTGDKKILLEHLRELQQPMPSFPQAMPQFHDVIGWNVEGITGEETVILRVHVRPTRGGRKQVLAGQAIAARLSTVLGRTIDPEKAGIVSVTLELGELASAISALDDMLLTRELDQRLTYQLREVEKLEKVEHPTRAYADFYELVKATNAGGGGGS